MQSLFDAFERDGLKGESGVWSTLFNDKRNLQIIPDNKLTEIIPKQEASDIVEHLNKIKDGTDTSFQSFDQYFSLLKEKSKSYIADYVKANQSQVYVTEDVIQASKNARAAQIAQNETMKAQTFSAKAGSVALKTLAVAGNMIAMWAVGQVISLAVKGIDNLIHASEKCKERVDELMSSYESALSAANANAKTVEGLADEYEKLSKGVNDLGQNVSLTSSEYEEYNKLVNQIADMFPELIAGHTAEGVAILSLKGNVEGLRDAYKEAQLEAHRLLISTGKDGNGKDIVENWMNNFKKNGTVDQIKFIDSIINAPRKEDLDLLWAEAVSDGHGDFFPDNIHFGFDELTDEEFNRTIRHAKVKKQELQASLDLDLDSVTKMANSFLVSHDGYEQLDEQTKSAASLLVNSLNLDVASAFNTSTAIGDYTNKIVDTLLTNTKVREAAIGLFTLNSNDLPIEDVEFLVNKYMEILGNALDIDSSDLKTQLGFDNIDELALQYRSAIGKFSDQDLSPFFRDSSINTSEELDYWLNVTEGAANATEAIEMYNAAKKQDLINSFDIANEETDKQIDEFQSRLTTLTSALKTLKEDGSLSTSALMDLKQQFPDLSTETDNLATELSSLLENELDSIVTKLEELGASDDIVQLFRDIADEADNLNSIYDVFDKAASSMSNLAELNRDLGDSYTLTTSEARKYAETMPEFLALGEESKNGLIQFNKETADSYIDSKAMEIQANKEARIAELTSMKSVLDGKISALEAELIQIESQGAAEIDTETQTSEGVANAHDDLTQHLVDSGVEQQTEDAAAKELMAGNTLEVDRVTADVAENVKTNLSNSINEAATNVNTRSGIMIEDLFAVSNQATTAANAVSNIGTGIPINVVKESVSKITGMMNDFDPKAVVTNVEIKTKDKSDITRYSIKDKDKIDTTGNVKSDRKDKVKSALEKTKKEAAEIDGLLKLLESMGESPDNFLPDTGKGGGSSRNSKDQKEESKKTFDWMQRTLDVMTKQREDHQAIVDDETQSYQDQLSTLQALIELDNQYIGLNEDAVSTYSARWEEAKENILKNFGEIEGNDIISKILYGDGSKEGSLSEYKNEDAEYIDIGIEALKNFEDAEDSLEASIDEHTEHIRKQYEIRLAEIKSYLDEVDSAMSQAEAKMDIKDITGGVVTEWDYKKLIALSEEQTALYYDQIEVLEEQLNTLNPMSAEYYNIKSSIASCESAIISAEKSQEEWHETIKRLPIERIQKYINMLQNIKQDLQNFLDEKNAMGATTTADQYQQLIDISQKEIKKMLEQQEKLKTLLNDYTYGSEKFNDISDEIQGIDDSISSLIQNQYEWNDAILNIPLNTMSELNNELSRYSDALNEVLSDYDATLNAVNTTLDKQIEIINDLKEAAENEYEAKIDPLNEELELLEKTNEARSIQLGLEQAQYDLEKAKSQKSNRVIRDGEIVYEADADSIRDANKSLADAQIEEIKYDLQTQIDNLTEERDKLLEGYDDEIERLSDIQDKWQSIVDEIQSASDILKANELLGSGWQDKIISGNDIDLYNMFQGMYQNTLTQKEEIEKQTASNERISEMMQLYVEQYQSGAITYEQAMSGIKELSSSMKDGYTVMEQLDALLSLSNIGDLSDLAGSVEGKVTDSIDLLAEYIDVVKSNNDSIIDYTSTWDEMKLNIAEQIEALKKAAEALEQLVNKRPSDSDSSSSSSSSGGGGGSYPNTSDNTYVASGPGDSDEKLQEAIDRGDKIIYKDGIKNGSIGNSGNPNTVNALKALAVKGLAPAEVPIIAHEGEVVLNEAQQSHLLSNFINNSLSLPSLPSVTNIVPKYTENSVNATFGDIILPDVKDHDGFAKAIATQFEPLLRQQISKSR